MVELTLEELLADPLIRLLMRRDGLLEFEVRAVMIRAKDALYGLRRSASDRSCKTQLERAFGSTL